ncbi:MAG: hypothetical protein IJR67_00035 [Acholeplasmatales bacterium]|nr:hypothetical protein [Acholeplasmatales bacterium]
MYINLIYDYIPYDSKTMIYGSKQYKLSMLYEKESALNNRQELHNKIRKAKSPSIEHNCYIKPLIIANYNNDIKGIFMMLNLQDSTNAKDYMYYEISTNDRKYISKYKTKLKNIYETAIQNNQDPLEYYLNTEQLTSFSNDDLKIYADAINFFYTDRIFNVRDSQNSHKIKVISSTWDNVLILNLKGNDTKFIAVFSRQYNYSRNKLTRLLSYYDDIKYFNNEDFVTINSMLNSKLNNMNQFINTIKKIKELSRK